MDRQTRVQYLVGHYENPRHRGVLDDPEVSLVGGNPGCGDVVEIHVRADGPAERFVGLAWEGEGCTISMAAASILAERVVAREMGPDDVMGLSYEEMIDLLGRDVVSSRPRCATLALGTLKRAVRELRSRRRLEASGEGPAASGEGPAPRDRARSEERGLVFGRGAEEAAFRGAGDAHPEGPSVREGGGAANGADAAGRTPSGRREG